MTAAGAADWYVSTAGSDANDGSYAHPFRTIQFAVRQCGASDGIIIRAGTYRGQVALAGLRGTSGAPIRIEGFPGERPVLKGSVVVSGWTLFSGAIWKRSNWTVASQQVFNDGSSLKQIGMPTVYANILMNGTSVYPQNGSGVASMTAGSFYYDAANDALYCWLSDGGDPNEHTIEASTAKRILSCDSNCAYIEVRNLSFRHCSSSAFEATGAGVELASNCLLEDCDVQFCDFGGVSLGYQHSGVRVRDCLIANNGGVGIQGSQHRAFLISGCEVSGNNTRRFSSFWHAGGMKFAADCSGVVRDCVIHDNRGPGCWFDTCDGGNAIEVRRNYIHHNNTSAAGVMIECSDNAQVCNNVLVANDNRGIYISASTNVQVHNNTLAGSRGWTALDISGMPRTGHSLKQVAAHNNIIVGSVGKFDLLIQKENGTDITGISSSNNCIWRGGSPLALWWGSDSRSGSVGTTYTSISAWRSTPFASGCVQADPKFLNATGSDYALAAGSPACNAGRTCSAVADDFLGLARPQSGAFDIGAYETSQVSPLPPDITTPAASSPANVVGTTAALSVGASDDGGNQFLTYTWRVAPGAPAPVYFSRNGGPDCAATVATFDKIGTYQLIVAVADSASHVSESSVTVAVTPTLSLVDVMPATAWLEANQTLSMQAEACDQFGEALAVQPLLAWSAENGAIDAAGLLVAPPIAAAPFAVTAAAGIVSGSGSVTVSDGFAATVNFQPAEAPTHANFLVDSGAPFAARGGKSYGWNADTPDSRDRNDSGSPNQAYDTFIHMQRPSNPDAVWEMTVPTGDYQVRVVCGDPMLSSGRLVIDVEGVRVLDATPSASLRWREGSSVVHVSDGRLTVRSGSGAENNKICFIEITAAPAADG
jgi:parallel beta-helix repeat protein